MVRYSLLHKRIIHATLLFHRAVQATIWSRLSCIHKNLWNVSRIIINSSFQLLVIHAITCIHLNAFMPYITTLHLHLCNQSFTPFIGIHPLHNYKAHKIFPMLIHSCYLAFNILCMAQPWLTHIGCITIINIINISRHDTFLYSNIHMVWGLLPLPFPGICHNQTLTFMGPTYTLGMTNLVGPLHGTAGFAHQLLSWTCCLIPFPIGLLVTFLSISNIFS